MKWEFGRWVRVAETLSVEEVRESLALAGGQRRG